MIRDVLQATGITATAGIGTNLYLAKVAMDIVAKKAPPDADGVRIAELDEPMYKRLLWPVRPLTAFWQMGEGKCRRLAATACFTMADIARTSIEEEEFLYRLFGVDAELLIDHAWGIEPCTMADIKAYRPRAHSLSVGQVLPRPYAFGEARLVFAEMAEQLAMDLVSKGLATDRATFWVAFDPVSLERCAYEGPVVVDYYGGSTPGTPAAPCAWDPQRQRPDAARGAAPPSTPRWTGSCTSAAWASPPPTPTTTACSWTCSPTTPPWRARSGCSGRSWRSGENTAATPYSRA